MKKVIYIFLILLFIIFDNLKGQCVQHADFSYTITGCHSIRFTNTSPLPGQIDSTIWNFGDGSPIVTNQNSVVHTFAGSGNFTVSLIIYRGAPIDCWDTTQQMVTIDPLPVANFSFAPLNACSGSNISFNDLSTGTSLDYSWNFDDGSPINYSSNPSHIFTSNGGGIDSFNVCLIVQDIMGCKDTTCKIIEIKQQPSVNFFESKNFKHCSYTEISEDTVTITNYSPDASFISNYFIQWGDGQDTSISSFTNISHIYIGTGTHPITITSTGNNGCQTVFNRLLIIENTPIAGIIGPLAGTNMGCAPLTVQIGNSSQNITDSTITVINWGDGNVLTLPIGTPTGGTYNHTYLNASCSQPSNQYNIKISVSNACGISEVTWSPVRVYEPPKANFNISSPTCINQPITFTNISSRNNCATDPNTVYTWDFGDGTTYGPTYVTYTGQPQQTISHTYNSVGTYVVTLTAENNSEFGCGSTTFQRTIVIGDLFPDFASDTSCVSEQVTHFTNLSSDTIIYITGYSWSFPNASPNSSSSISPNTTYYSPGNQSATLTVYANNGCAKSITKPVYVWHLPNPNFSFINMCVYDSIPFTNLSTTSVDNAPLTHWSYNFNDGSLNDTFPNTLHKFPQNGEYRVYLTVWDSNGCYKTSNYKTVTVFPQPTASFSNTLACDSQVVNFYNSSSSPLHLSHNYFDCAYNNCSYWWCYYCEWLWNTNLTYEWNFGDGSPDVTSTNTNHTYSPPGSYTVQLIATNTYGCKDTMTKVIPVNIRPLANFVADTVCFKDTTNFINLTDDRGGTPVTNNYWNFGDAQTSNQVSPDHYYNTAGQYNVMYVATNQIGCKDTIIKPVRVWRLPNTNFNVNNICLYDTLMPINLSTVTDAGFMSSIWDYGDGTIDTTVNPSNLYDSSGLYYVSLTMIDSNLCSNTLIKPVRVYALPQADFYTSATCMSYETYFYDSTTIINSFVNGNISNWYWDFGDSTFSTLQNPINIYDTVGLYNVTLIASTSHGCSDTIAKEITVFKPPKADFRFDTVCFKLPTTFTDLSIPMPADIISWHWEYGDGANDSIQNPQHVFAYPGTFNTMLTVYDTNGCYNEKIHQVIVDSLPVLNFSSPNVCFGDTFRIINQTYAPQGSNITFWYWDYGDGTIDSTNNPPDHIYSEDTIYTVILVAENDLGCRDTLARNIQVYTLPTANFVASQACQGLPVMFTDSSYNPIANITNWLWDFGDGHNGNVQNPIHVYPYPGDTVFTVSLEIIDQHSCRDSITKVIYLNRKPIANFVAAPTCSNDTTFFIDSTISSGPISIYHWNFGDGIGNSNLQNPAYIYPAVSNPTYFNASLFVTDTKGCKDTVVKPVLIYPLPIPMFSADSVCYGSTTHFTDQSNSHGGAIINWYWNFGDTIGYSNVQNPTYVYSSPITNITHYQAQLTTTDVNGCKNSIVRPVIVYPLPIPEFSMDTTCFGNSTQFNDLSYSNGGDLTNWYWDFGDGMGNSSIQNPSYTFNAYGIYNVSLTVTDINNCTNTVAHIAEIDSLPTPQFTVVGLCAQDTTHFIDMSLANGGNIEYYYWSFGDQYYSDLQNPVHFYLVNDTFTVTLTVMNSKGCMDSIEQQIVISPPLLLNYNFDTVCAGTPTHFLIDVISSGSGISSFNWDFGDGEDTIDTDLFCQHIYNDGGYYSAILMVTDSNNCTREVTKLVPVLPAAIEPGFTSTTPEFCYGDSAYIFALYNTENSNIYWYDANMNNIAIGDTLSLGPIYQSTTIFAENITDLGCHNLGGLYHFNVLVNNLPELNLTSDKYNNTAYLGQIVTIIAEPSNYESYSFYLNGQLVQSSSSNIYLSNKFYDGDVISAYAFNGTCISPLDTLRLTILPIPNAFTPDGDGINDRFAKGLDIQIFNRWGQLLYEGEDGWDGTYNGDLVQAGTYYYIIRLPQIEEEDKVINGVVTVVR